jgi:LacI family transcriptional regulator
MSGRGQSDADASRDAGAVANGTASLLANRPATLTDVARLAGVSAATASRVLNRADPRVTAPLRRRVLDAARRLDYVPNAHAQALKRSDRNAVGVVAPFMSNPHFTEIISGILLAGAQAGRLVTVGNAFGYPETELQYIEQLRSQRVGSLVLTGSGWTDAEHVSRLQARVEAFRASGGRIALVGRRDVAGDLVVPDNAGGARAAARALLELGHTKVGVVAGPSNIVLTGDRLSGFLEAYADAGHPIPPERIEAVRFTHGGGAKGMERLLDRVPEITAVFCLSDSHAVGALRVLRERGIEVPREMSVMGFDGLPFGAELTPALSTIYVPLMEMGRAAIRLVVEPGDGDARTHYLATELRMRGTTGPPRS